MKKRKNIRWPTYDEIYKRKKEAYEKKYGIIDKNEFED